MTAGRPVAILFLLLATLASAKITLVYPRVAAPGDTFTYADGIDSSFALGNVGDESGQLLINGQTVPLTDRGAFLAFLPLSRLAGTKVWRLALIEQTGRVLDSMELPYRFASDVGSLPVSPDTFDFPRVISVSLPNAQTRTVEGGAYEFFPVPDTRLLATGTNEGYFRFSVGARTGVIDRRFATVTTETSLNPVVLGNGLCTVEGDELVMTFDLSGPALWRSELAADRHRLTILLGNTVCGLDRIEYRDWAAGISDVSWTQSAEGVELSVTTARPILRGYHVDMTATELRIRLLPDFSSPGGSLRGKTVVVDAGHGGSAYGAVGALGTREKDIALRWSRALEAELVRAGARVVQTRSEDVDLTLYDRCDRARSAHADCFLSLHANALPDGRNPWLKHGSGTYYYQAESRPLAERIQREILTLGGLRDDGVYDANLAVVRPTEFPAVLIESAYLIHPDEEQLLLSDDFLRRLSRAVVRGLAAYFRTMKAEK